MSKPKLQVFGFVLVFFVLLSALQLPRGPQFICEQGNGGSHQIQYGFPLVFVQRSVSPSACTFVNGQETQAEYDYYGTHHIKPLNFVADIVIWSLVAVGVLLLLENQRRTKK